LFLGRRYYSASLLPPPPSHPDTAAPPHPITEIQATQVTHEAIKEDLERLVILAKSKDIPLGAVQALISRLWRVAA
jgi:hypothetical protein